MPAACRAQKAQRRDLTCVAVGCRLLATRREHGQQNSTKQRYEPSSFYPRLFFVYRSTDDISKLPPKLQFLAIALVNAGTIAWPHRSTHSPDPRLLPRRQ
jgi:hypothetical protein